MVRDSANPLLKILPIGRGRSPTTKFTHIVLNGILEKSIRV